MGDLMLSASMAEGGNFAESNLASAVSDELISSQVANENLRSYAEADGPANCIAGQLLRRVAWSGNR